MRAKPVHLGPEFGAQFNDRSVVEAYQLRPPYSDEAFDILVGLVTGTLSAVLDLGCGTGEIARRIAPRCERVDAVDLSGRMIARAKTSPGGGATNIRWIEAPAETAPLQGPYDLVIAGASIHWMDWDVVLARLDSTLAPGGYVAILEQDQDPVPWQRELTSLCGQYSTNRTYQPYNIVEELAKRDLFRVAGFKRSEPQAFDQPMPDYIESFHARNGFSRDRMRTEAADTFDRRVADLVAPLPGDGNVVHLMTREVITWGRPAPPPRDPSDMAYI